MVQRLAFGIQMENGPSPFENRKRGTPMHGLLLLLALHTPTDTGRDLKPAPKRTDVVLRWNEVALDALRAEKTPPPMAARHLAMMHAAIYDSVNTVYQTHRPYRVALKATEPVEPAAAAAVAAHCVLVALYPCRRAQFDRALDESLAPLKAGAARRRGVQLGHYVAEKVLAWRRADGSARRVAYVPDTAVGLWRPTPPKFAPALLPHWSEVTPFGVRSAAGFRPVPPPKLTSSEYTRDFNEVKRLGGRNSRARTADQTLIAWFWDDGAGTCTPPGHWNLIAQVVARQQGNTLSENARLFALLNFALADAGMACWECKYKFRLWRPITAIRQADRDGNPDTAPDPDWESLLTTPPFPSYTSGHSTFSAAGAAVLAYFYGTDEVRFTVGSDGLPGHRRTYARFSAAADEAGLSRIYGGIHFECDNREGKAAGRAVAAQVCRLCCVPRPPPGATASR
jgi:hypothetical protein